MKQLSTLAKCLKMPALLLAALVALPVLPAGQAYAEEAVCVFLSQRDNAWVIRKDATVKQSLNVGDSLYDGDRLVVMRGNTVQLAFDKEARNVVHIEGGTELQISGARPTNLDMSAGKIFAILNKKGPESLFKVTSPTAIAAVRGTQFQVDAMGPGTQIHTYEGSVKVSGRDAMGSEMNDFVIVSAGQKTSVASKEMAPAAATDMTAAEQAELMPVLARLAETQEMISRPESQAWFSNKDGSSAGGGSAKKPATDEKGKLIL